MDDFARHRFQQGKRHYRSMQWPNWEALGMGDTTSAAYDATGLLSHTPEEGLRLFEQALAVDCAVTLPCVSTGELRFEVSPAAAPARRVPQAHDTRQPRQQAANSTMDWLSELFARELKLGSSRLDPRAGFADQGIDSILMAELVRSIERALGVSLPPSLLFEHTTVAALHDYLARDFPEAIKARGGADEAVAATVVQPEYPRPYSSRPDSLSADIAVIGLSCRFPGAPDATAFWNLLRRGESAIGRTPEERWAEVGREWFGGFVEGIDEFDPEFFRLSEEDAAIMDPQARLILEESARTLYDAGYGEHGLDGRRVGVYIGARASAARDENILRAANPILGLGQNYIAANISRCFNFAGPSLVVDTACSSALVGMHLAVRALQNGEIDYALVGGVSLLLDDTAHRLFASRRLLRPDGVFHLFDRRADGVVLGEGAGAVLLKPLDAALRDGDCIEGVIKGIAVNNNGRTAGPNAPSFQAQKDVIAAALRESGKRADEIAEIEASGSGSMVNDLLELKSLAAVLGGKRATCYLGSVKTNVGHLLSAAGAASFLKAVLSVRHGEHTPHLSAEQLPLYFDFKQAGFEIGRKLRPWAGPGSRTACVTSFPDGGTNCCVVIEYPEAIPAARREAIPGPFFRKRKLIERRIGEALEAEAAIRPVRAAVPEPVFAVANGKGEDFWGLTE
jgi:3-oxoacyl-(acyl-carrier-protein) synthase/acyl carrier protein